MAEALKEIRVACFHCGDDCQEGISFDNKLFCCNGCKNVYQILDDNQLCDYYTLENHPGNKTSQVKPGQYSFLDEEKIKNSLLKYQDGTISAITFYIPSVHCSSCIWVLENLHKIKPGVITSSLHFQKKELDIQFNNTVSLSELAHLLDTIGYPPLITLNGRNVTNKSVDKDLYYKIGIAGFCFGNIMLLSIPEYVSAFNDFQVEFKTFFSWLNLILAIPVFFYGASDYFFSAWQAIKTRIINIDLPIVLGLIAAFAQSTYEVFSQTGTGYFDSLTGLIFFLLIGKWYQKKTYAALSFERDYKSYFPLATTVLKHDKENYVGLNELKAGDKILIRNQEVIPADGIIRKGEGQIDYSFVTGESVPVPKNVGERVFAGGKQMGSALEIEVIKEVSESYLTQLWNKDSSKRKDQSNLTHFTNKVGKYFTVAVILIAVGAYLYWYKHNPSIALYSAVSVLIIFCPCTLGLAIPFCFGNAMNILGKNGFFLKNTEAIERLAGNQSIVFDKTGTITNTGLSDIVFDGFLTKREKEYVKSLVKSSTHPLSRKLYSFLQGADSLPVLFYEESLSQGISGIIDGNEVKVGSAAFTGISANKRPLNKGNSQVFVSINNEVKACFNFQNSYREGIHEVLTNLGKQYQLHLLSGDNASEKSNLQSLFSLENLHFNQSPHDKLKYIQKLEQSGKTMMIGDGLNDAGALKESHCGITISENNGSFSPACDAIMDASALKKLPDFLSYAKSCVKIVRSSLFVSLAYNIIGLFFAVQGLLKPVVAAILMPLSSVTMVLFVTLLSNYMAKRKRLK